MMDFEPLIPVPPKRMDPRIYADGPMGLRDALLEIPLDRRLTYDADHNALFIKVYAIVNYDNFEIAPEVEDEYVQMVKGLADAYYWNVTRYTTSGFLRLKLGQALAQRGVAPHVYESSEEALKHLREIEDDAAG